MPMVARWLFPRAPPKLEIRATPVAGDPATPGPAPRTGVERWELEASRAGRTNPGRRNHPAEWVNQLGPGCAGADIIQRGSGVAPGPLDRHQVASLVSPTLRVPGRPAASPGESDADWSHGGWNP